MITPNPNYTPNPKRAIYVQGVIDQDMVYRLTPPIISLLKIREPITVYIDSRGGRVDFKDSIYELLRSSTEGCDPPCKFITVAVNLAGSSAADLLSSGWYALAYPDTILLYHGVRVASTDGPLTAEATYSLAQRLRAGNESYATRLARDTERRFMFRYVSHHDDLPTIRKNNPQKPGKPALSNLQCFLTLLSERVSTSATKVLADAYERYLIYDALLSSAAKKWKKGAAKKSFVQLEVDQIKAVMEFEVKRNKKKKHWKFETEGIHRITDDFFMLNEYLAFLQGPRFADICTTWGTFLLTAIQTIEVDSLPTEAEKDKKIIEIVSPELRPVWSYFMALCHVLQQSENWLTAIDGFWLGLIDDVIGEKGLPSFRLFAEQGAELAKNDAQAKVNKKKRRRAKRRRPKPTA